MCSTLWPSGNVNKKWWPLRLLSCAGFYTLYILKPGENQTLFNHIPIELKECKLFFHPSVVYLLRCICPEYDLVLSDNHADLWIFTDPTHPRRPIDSSLHPSASYRGKQALWRSQSCTLKPESWLWPALLWLKTAMVCPPTDCMLKGYSFGNCTDLASFSQSPPRAASSSFRLKQTWGGAHTLEHQKTHY